MFEELFLKVLGKHAPVKKKVVRANHANYISKPLRKIYCSRLYKKERKNFFNSLNTSLVIDNKLF